LWMASTSVLPSASVVPFNSLSSFSDSSSASWSPSLLSPYPFGHKLLSLIHQRSVRFRVSLLLTIFQVPILAATTILLCQLYEHEEQLSPVISKAFLLYLHFIQLKCLITLILYWIRYRHEQLWVNSWTDGRWSGSSPGQRCYYRLTLLVRLLDLSFALAALGLTASLLHSQGLESFWIAVMLIVICLELMLFCLPFGSMIVCLVIFPLHSLSTTAPFIHISESSTRYYQQQNANSNSLSSTGCQLMGLSDDDLLKLPCCSFVPLMLPAEDSLCVICLQQFKVNESVRLLHCHHCYHQKCIDEWLTKKLTCPLCCRTIQPEIELIASQSTVTLISHQTTSNSSSSRENSYSVDDDLC